MDPIYFPASVDFYIWPCLKCGSVPIADSRNFLPHPKRAANWRRQNIGGVCENLFPNRSNFKD